MIHGYAYISGPDIKEKAVAAVFKLHQLLDVHFFNDIRKCKY